ncbi:MAG: phosphatase PAP2 family protein [Desulfovibrio sp.]
MRLTHPITHWIITIFPLAAVLAALYFYFGNEQDIIVFFREYRTANPALTSVFTAITNFGNAVLYPVFAWLAYKAYKRGTPQERRFIIGFIVIQLLVALAATRFLKIAIGKPRPDADGIWTPWTTKGSHHSMPSGHTTEITGACTSLSLGYSKLLISLSMGLITLMIGFSRIYLGWHHVSDVAAGLALGSLTGFAVRAYTLHKSPNKKRKANT